jgi:hypothetical protein
MKKKEREAARNALSLFCAIDPTNGGCFCLKINVRIDISYYVYNFILSHEIQESSHGTEREQSATHSL